MESVERLQKMYQKAELNPDLKPYYIVQNGIPMIKHPLVFSIFHMDIQNYIINQHYEWKKKAVKDAIKSKKWSSFIFLHERPYRLDAFIQIEQELRKKPKEYWNVLGSIWVDSENIWQNIDEWRFLLKEGPEKDREYFMSKEDRAVFNELPQKLVVYRGYVPRQNKSGFSYTLNPEKAEWFSKRFGKPGKVLKREVNKEQVFAYKNDRNEQEIIILD